MPNFEALFKSSSLSRETVISVKVDDFKYIEKVEET
jgi:hypothetical protein